MSWGNILHISQNILCKSGRIYCIIENVLHNFAERYCVFQKLFCAFFWEKTFAFEEAFCISENIWLVGVLSKKVVSYIRKIFAVIQETFWALLKKDFVYLRQYFVHFLKKDIDYFLQKDFVYFGKGLPINKKRCFLIIFSHLKVYFVES